MPPWMNCAIYAHNPEFCGRERQREEIKVEKGLNETEQTTSDDIISGSRQERLVIAIGRFMCHIGAHKWGEPYTTAGVDYWFFGMGHHAQDCTRKDCEYVRRFAP